MEPNRESVEDRAEKEGRGSERKEGQRQGVCEHYSVESDVLPENERKRVSRGK